ncbi:hypothetical protein EDD85DRAFT_788477 [Armillaria nabsnona]|nr:hypothetical protein EDD85DRAFT_788477 [Armillaria nabsnona]
MSCTFVDDNESPDGSLWTGAGLLAVWGNWVGTRNGGVDMIIGVKGVAGMFLSPSTFCTSLVCRSEEVKGGISLADWCQLESVEARDVADCYHLATWYGTIMVTVMITVSVMEAPVKEQRKASS